MADKDIKELAGDIPDLTKKILDGIENGMEWAAKNVYDEIQMSNPVDTGFSRANWNISVGQPDFTVHGERVEGSVYEAPTTAVPEDPELKPIFVSNGVPYIGRLEEGSSTQAPAGFVAVAVEKTAGQLQGHVNID